MTQTSQEVSKGARETALRMVHGARAAHIGSSLSLIDILSVIYTDLTDTELIRNGDPSRDLIFVSKGHAAAGTYAVLAQVGLIQGDAIDHYCEDGHPLGGHVTSHACEAIELSTGSLGHALPYAVGCMIASARAKRNRKCWVVISDGECDEGANWEAALLASHHKLHNLTVIIDRNGLQSLTSTEDTLALEPLAAKWSAFNWDVLTIDGHDHSALAGALGSTSNRPRCVIAQTVKGRGVRFMENEVKWHYRPPDAAELQLALEGLEAQ